MQYLMTPHSGKIEPFVWWEGAFTSSELDWLQNKAKNATNKAQVGGNSGGGGAVNAQARRSEVDWLDNTPDTKWVFDKFADVALRLNAEHYRFDLTGFGEPLQLTHYDQADNGMNGWHQDYGTRVSRKLSMTMQLTNPSEYEGGDFEFFNLVNFPDKEIIRKQGTILFFPSFLEHQATPVTKGKRNTLAAWFEGPKWR